MNDWGPPPYASSAGDALRDRDLMLRIWAGNLGAGDHMARKYDWFYLDCPYGAPLVERLHHAPSAEWVGVCSMGRRRMLWRGREIRTGVMVDLAVLPMHRSLGPALTLQQGLLDSGRRELDLALGFPNPKAAAVFKRIRYEKFADIVRHARVLRHAGYLRRRLPSWLARPAGALLDLRTIARIAWARLRGPALEAAWSDHAVDDMDTLWQHSPHGQALLAIRDAEYVRWRFDASPLFTSRHLLVRDPTDGSLIAWFATRREDNVLHLMDFWSSGAIDGVEPHCIETLIAAAWRSGCESISMQAATSPARMTPWVRLGFVERARRPVFGSWSTPPTNNTGDLDIHLTVGDEDE